MLAGMRLVQPFALELGRRGVASEARQGVASEAGQT